MNRREKQEYLQGYESLKKKGKPFFPYAVLKDSVMVFIVVIVIAVMSVVLGAELGPKVDPTTTTYVPRPEWYFFFLFELLRVIKPAELTPVATIGIPTICMVLLLLLPFYDRNPERRPERRPIATTAGILTIIAMAYLTFLGANAGSPNEVELEVANLELGRASSLRAVGLRGLPQDRRERKRGPGPELTDIARRLPGRRSTARWRSAPGSCPPPSMPQQKQDDLTAFLASLDQRCGRRRRGGPALCRRLRSL